MYEVKQYINHKNLFIILQDQFIQTSLIFLVIISCVTAYFISVFGGILITLCYVAGLVLSNIICHKNSPLNFCAFLRSLFIEEYSFQSIRPHSKECHVCLNSNCKRQISTKNSSPWQGLLLPKEIDQAIQDLLNKILNEFVMAWYSELSKDESFIYEIRKCLRFASSVFLRQALEVNIIELITDQLIITGFSHCNDYVSIVEYSKLQKVPINVAAVKYLGPRLHPAVENRKTEISYLRCLTGLLMSHLLPERNINCGGFKSLIQEILAGWVLLPISDTLSDPYIVNSLLEIALNKEPLTQYPDSCTSQVEFLKIFIISHKESPSKKSALYIELSTILKEKDLLYLFMQFLKKEGSLHYLQFLLDVEAFNIKMLPPDLDKSNLETLYTDAQTLYNMYFNIESHDSLNFSNQIIQQMDRVLSAGPQNILKLRTSTLLFGTYDDVYMNLEKTYCPLFYQSEENLARFCNLKKGVGYTRSRSNRKPSEGGPISKLKVKWPKVLQVQPVVGSAYYSDVPLDVADNAEDLESSPESSSRNINSWKVNIPRVEQRQDHNSKPYNVFVVQVSMCESGCQSEWSIYRKQNDFYVLQSKLAEFHGEFVDVQLTPINKKPVMSYVGESAESKRRMFNDYLQTLIQLPRLSGSDLLYTFLRAENFVESMSDTDGLGKMLKRSVQPIKLRKERGQHLDNFLTEFLTSTEGLKRTGKHEWQDATVDPPRYVRCLTNTIYEDCFQSVNTEEYKELFPMSSSGNLVLTGPWDCILFVLVKLMNVPMYVLQLAISIKSMLGSSADSVLKNLLDKTLRRVLVPPRMAHLVRLLQGALFNSKPVEDKKEAELKEQVLQHIQQLDVNIALKWLVPHFHEGLETIFDCLQQPLLNKHLSYRLLDEIVRCMYPDIAVPFGIHKQTK